MPHLLNKKLAPARVFKLFSGETRYAQGSESAGATTLFPGLRQMAVFSGVGLFAAWLTVVLLFPLLTKGEKPVGGGVFFHFAQKDQV